MSETKLTFGEWLLTIAIAAPVLLFIMLLAIPIGLFTTWARLKLWEWFAVPYLHLPDLSFWTMYGLTVLIGTFYYAKVKVSDYTPTWKDNLTTLGANVGGWFLSLGIGYVVHTYILK